MSPLYAHISMWIPRDFIWGETDCLMVLADWVKFVRGVDPAERYRGTYDSPLTAEKVSGFMMHPLRVTTECFEEVAGLEPTENPVAGDVAVLSLPVNDKFRCCGAICLGEHGWAVKAPRGATTIKSAVFTKAWSVGYVA